LGGELIALAGALHSHLLLSDSPLSVFRGNLAGCLCLPTNKICWKRLIFVNAINYKRMNDEIDARTQGSSVHVFVTPSVADHFEAECLKRSPIKLYETITDKTLPNLLPVIQLASLRNTVLLSPDR
jgi:hypothetical protein